MISLRPGQQLLAGLFCILLPNDFSQLGSWVIAVEPTQSVPIRVDAAGSWRVGQSRVTAEVVFGQFNRGSTPEQIQDDFQSLSLADIYGTISYYLSHPREAEAYLAERKTQAAEIRAKCESLPETGDFRRKLREARDLRPQRAK
ncbi:MAG: hypothetical protein ACI8UO_002210 [Verrucomicrobiales bacterium]